MTVHVRWWVQSEVPCEYKEFWPSYEEAQDKDDCRLRMTEQPANSQLPDKWPLEWFV